MRILLIAHGFPPHAAGGAELYAEAHARALAASGDDVLVMAREADPARAEFSVRRERRDGIDIAWINNTWRRVRSFTDTYADDRIDAAAAPVITAFAPDVAHVHHLTGLSSSLVPAIAARGTPVFVTLHDYWLLCHRGQLLDRYLRPCHASMPGACETCIDAAALASGPAFVARSVAVRWLPASLRAGLRRIAAPPFAAGTGDARAAQAAAARWDHMRRVLAVVTQMFAPSAALRDRFIAAGIDPARIGVSPYGWSLPPARALVPIGLPPHEAHQRAVSATPAVGASATRSGPLRVGFLGSLMVSKAPHVLLDACARLPAGAVSVHVYGAPADYHGDARYRAALAPRLSRAGVEHHGPVPRARIAETLASLDVLVVPSVWPENSPLVIHEAFLAGVPVVASRIGGIPELVVDGVNGLLVEPGDAAGLARALRRLLEDPDLLARLRTGIRPVRAIEDDVASMRATYARVLAAPPVGDRLAAVVLNYRTPDETWLAVRSLMLSSRPIDQIVVVNNGGADDAQACRRALGPHGDRVTLVSTGANLGFSGGVNAGIRAALAAGAGLVLLVNSDVVLHVDAVAALERALAARKDAGIAGPLVIARQAPDRIASAGIDYARATGRMRHRGQGAAADAWPGAIADVAAVSGCAMLVRGAVFDRAGLFDERYFFGFEDIDLCLRAREAGLAVIIAPAARALHEGGRSIGARAGDRLYYAARNHLWLARRAGGPGGVAGRAARSAWIVALNVAHALRVRGGSALTRLGAVAAGTRDAWRGSAGPRRRRPGDHLD